MTDRRDDLPKVPAAALDALFAEARAQGPDGTGGPTGALLARVMADADAAMPAARRRMQVSGDVDTPGRGGWLQSLLAGLGGWGGIGGLASAALAGVWIGFSGQAGGAAVADFLSDVSWTTGTVELSPDAESFFAADLSEG